MRPILFPRDELAHKSTIEWWYWNGHLQDKQGHAYSYMDCLFKADTKKVKIPFLSKMPFPTIYFSHSLVSDIAHQKFYPVIDFVSMASKDSWTKPLLYVNYTSPFTLNTYFNNIMESPKPFQYHLKTELLDLTLTSKKPPLLEGGNGYLILNTKKTYYYSLTRLETEGTIRIKNKTIPVSGISWMDHQWADVAYSKDKWTWFSVQLEDGTDMVCFEYLDKGVKNYLASFSLPSGRTVHTHDVRLTALGKSWVSPKTKTEYPLAWRIEVPSRKVDLKVEPCVKNQEMNFGAINYWEGGLHVTGTMGGKPAKGVGFLELVGYPSMYSDYKFLKDILMETQRRFVKKSRKKLGL